MEEYLIWITLVFRNNYYEISKMLNIFNSVEEIYNISSSEWNNFNLNENIIKRITLNDLKAEAQKIYKKCLKENIKLLPLDSPEYPVNLKNIDYPPFLLYYMGELKKQDECSISVVGSRSCTSYGRVVTEKIVSELADSGITIISGMATGIDSIAHITALKSSTRTIAVLGCGVNIIYPAENKSLYYKIIDNGAVFSEFVPNTKAYPSLFPKRNAIISGMSLGTLVIEATSKSGSMITARLAGEQGRDIFAVPGNILTPQSEGTNNLIKDGAKVVTTSDDILEEIHERIKHIIKDVPKTNNKVTLSEQQLLVFNNISGTPVNIDNLFYTLNIPIPELNSTLTTLELTGYIKKIEGEQFIRC